MPPLYGEGEDAFRRLQLEILSKEDEESIFAWVEEGPYWKTKVTGLLARYPAAFQYSGEFKELRMARKISLLNDKQRVAHGGSSTSSRGV
jgi:hypothetical protein